MSRAQSPHRALIAVASVVGVAAFFGLRLNWSSRMVNIDEIIPLGVSVGMTERGDLDPNWGRANVPADFKYDQYNFYLYNLVAHGVIRAAGALGVEALPALRLANVLFQLAALALVIDLLRRLKSSPSLIAFGAAVFILAPSLVQDATMARPESLVYLLSALLLWVMALEIRPTWRVALAGVVLGAGCAVKVSFASAAVAVVLAVVFAWPRVPAATYGVRAAMLVGGVLVGFVVSAPLAIKNFDVFLKGLNALSAQYSQGHQPFSYPDYSAVSHALRMARYFLELYSVVPLLAVASLFLLRGTDRAWAATLVSGAAVLFAYFVTKPVFFERNLAHGVVGAIAAAAMALPKVTSPRARGLLMLTALVPMAVWSLQIQRAVHDPDRLARFEKAEGVEGLPRVPTSDVLHGTVPQTCERVAVLDYGDPYARDYLGLLKRSGFREVARYDGRFHPLSFGTLQVYLDSDVAYFKCPGSP